MFLKSYKTGDYETLEYLQKKYELVILTNWFKDAQINRLKNIGIYKYFKEIYGAEKYAKPYKESYIQAVGPHSLDECVMVGDNIETDIKGAKNAGINFVVWRDNKGEKEKYVKDLEDIYIISELGDLMKIL